jgi:hypothetical protein
MHAITFTTFQVNSAAFVIRGLSWGPRRERGAKGRPSPEGEGSAHDSPSSGFKTPPPGCNARSENENETAKQLIRQSERGKHSLRLRRRPSQIHGQTPTGGHSESWSHYIIHRHHRQLSLVGCRVTDRECTAETRCASLERRK